MNGVDGINSVAPSGLSDTVRHPGPAAWAVSFRPVGAVEKWKLGLCGTPFRVLERHDLNLGCRFAQPRLCCLIPFQGSG